MLFGNRDRFRFAINRRSRGKDHLLYATGDHRIQKAKAVAPKPEIDIKAEPVVSLDDPAPKVSRTKKGGKKNAQKR